MARPVRLSILGDASDAIRALQQSAAAALGFGNSMDGINGRLRKTSATVKASTDATKKLGDKLSDSVQHAADLDSKIGTLTRSLKTMAQSYAATGDKGILTTIRKAESEIRALTKVKHHLEVEVDVDNNSVTRSGNKFVSGITNAVGTAAGVINGALGKSFSSLPPQAQAGLTAGIVAAVAAAAPFAGGLLAAGILGGLAAGGVAAGIAAIMRDAQLKAEAAAFGEYLADTLSKSAIAFKPAIRDAMSYFRGQMQAITPDLRRIFDQSSTFVRPLSEGIAGFIRNVLPGIESGLSKAEPVISALVTGVKDFGTTIGESFEAMGSGAEGAGVALKDMFATINMGIKDTSMVVGLLAKIYPYVRPLPSALMDLADGNDQAAAATKAAADASFQSQAALDAHTAAAKAAADAVQAQADAARDAAQAIRDYHSAVSSLVDGQLAAEQAVDDASAAIKENGRTIDITSQKGRDNVKAVKGIADEYVGWAQQAQDAGAKQSQVNAILGTGYSKFMAAAKGAGFNAGQADKLARSLGLIPATKDTKIKMDADKAKSDSKQVVDNIAGIKSKTVTITVKPNVLPGEKNFIGPVAVPRGVARPEGLMAGRFGAAAPAETIRTASASASGGGKKNPLARYMESLGKSVGLSFIKGMTSTLWQIQSTSESLIRKVRDAFKGSKETRLVKMITADTKALVGLSKTRDRVANQLKAAQDRLENIQKAKADVVSSITSTIQNSFKLVDDAAQNGATSLRAILARSARAVKDATAFAANLALLKARGLNAAQLQELANAGPAAAASTVKALLTANKDDIAKLNSNYDSLKRTGKSLGNSVGDALYGAGIRAAQGIVNGLLRDKKAIERTMLTIAIGMQKAIKRALGIKSPSTVFRSIGEQIQAGLAKGAAEGAGTAVVGGMVKSIKQAAPALTDALPGIATPNYQAVSAGAGATVIEMTVNTGVIVDKRGLTEAISEAFNETAEILGRPIELSVMTT